jgi:hypothetical protein
MGIDASLLFYRGEPLSPQAWGAVFKPVLAERVGERTLAFVHTERANRSKASKRAPLHSVGLFQGGETPNKKILAHVFETKQAELDAIKQRANDPNTSLASIVQAAMRIARDPINRSLPQRERDEDSSWIPDLACGISAIRGEALWAMACDHSLVGAIARAKNGALLFAREVDGDDYESEPNAELADFADWRQASVHRCFNHPLDEPRDEITYFLVASGGTLFDSPIPVDRAELEDFEHILMDFDE